MFNYQRVSWTNSGGVSEIWLLFDPRKAADFLAATIFAENSKNWSMMKTHPRTSRPQFCVPGVTLIYVLYRAVGGWRCKNSPTIFAANPDIFLQITTSHFSSERIPVLGEECFAFSGTLASYKDLVSRGYRLQTTSPGLAYGCISLLSTMDVRTSRLACQHYCSYDVQA